MDQHLDLRELDVSVWKIECGKYQMLQICMGEAAATGGEDAVTTLSRKGVISKKIETYEYSDRKKLTQLSEQYKLITLVFDNFDPRSLECARRIAPIVKENRQCVVGICCDCNDEGVYPEREYNANYDEGNRPAEYQCADIANIIDSLIFVQLYAEFGFQVFISMVDAITALFSLCVDNQDASLKRSNGIKRLINKGIGYYHKVYIDSVPNIKMAINKAVADSFFACPFYASDDIVCRITCGKRHALSMSEEKNVITFRSILEYFPQGVAASVHTSVDENMPQYDIVIEFLFLGVNSSTSRDHNDVSKQILTAEQILRQRKRIGKMLLNSNF